MAKMTLEKFRAEAGKRRAGRPRGAARYTDELKQFALAHADKRMAEGRSGQQAAKELDLCAVTLYGWQKERRAPKGELKPVQIADVPRTLPAPKARAKPKPRAVVVAAEREDLLLRTPEGYEVRGLDVDSLAELLRALS